MRISIMCKRSNRISRRVRSRSDPFASREETGLNGRKARQGGEFRESGDIAVRRIPIPCILESASLLDSLSGLRYSTGYDFFLNIRPAFGMSNSDVHRDRPSVSIDYRYHFDPPFFAARSITPLSFHGAF
ncbi:hypothetical protein BGL_2c02010 [Burkholderia plantarii]|uniref:Uncharacterized protein n=1 Tax=Burkholderia plantarii TaxID=41899 RepID=A0A0B6RSJ3_BURPL|nr:hypothetical protein BGL_2c02010 [Burkholderia plantarii]